MSEKLESVDCCVYNIYILILKNGKLSMYIKRVCIKLLKTWLTTISARRSEL